MNRSKILNFIKNSIIVIFLIFIIYLIIPLPQPLFKTDYSQIVTDRNNNPLRIFLNKDEQWCFPPEYVNKEIPDKLKKALIYYEDEYFKWHPGVNPVSLFRALRQNIKSNKIISGASTITMQIARLLNRNERTIFNKIKEIFLAIKIELYYSKDEILKLYLEHAPFGSNIIGYLAASYKYFEKIPQNLSWSEAAAIAVLPNAPGLIVPSSTNQLLKQKRDRLLKKLYKKNVISKSTYHLAIKEPIIKNIYPFEVVAGHFARKVSNENKSKKIIKTTIDIELQRKVEFIVKQYSYVLQNQGIQNCSAIILDTKTGEIKSYIGSQDYFDRKNNGMVDGVIAPRSSASILKPFLYALSIDEGIIIPQTLLRDIPSYFGSFVPQNADMKFNGVVRAKEALVRSLNIPAIRLLNTYGIYKFYSFLKRAGITTLFRSADGYSLPLIIGGAEVNLFDVTKLYRGLANKGFFNNSEHLIKNYTIKIKAKENLISSGSCYLTLNMLKDVNRPGLENYWKQFQNQHPIAWKTGTSYGSKDAWAVGVSPEWTIGVWCGNFTGEPNTNLSGVASAGPLMFEIFNNLPKSTDARWFEKNDGYFTNIKICKITGFLAGKYCNETEQVDVPYNMFPLRLCEFHKNLFIDEKTGYSVCSNCWKENYKEKQLLIFPSEVNYYLRERGKFVEQIPEHNPNCTRKHSSSPLKIMYPQDSTKLWLPYDFGGNIQKLVVKISYNHKTENENIFWYLDDIYLGITKSKHEKELELKTGRHTLSVLDHNGNFDKVTFYVAIKEK